MSAIDSNDSDNKQSPTEDDISIPLQEIQISDNKGSCLSPQQEAAEVEDCTLFVGDLAKTITEDELVERFGSYGKIVFVDVKRDKVTGNMLGYGFIQFQSRDQAEAAKLGLDGQDVGGRALRIGWAQKNTNLFIGDLDPTVTTRQLKETFSRFGPIVDDGTFVKHNSYGFVKFVHRAHAEQAKREMDGQVVGNRPIRIGWGDTQAQKHCVYVQFDNCPKGFGLTEDELKRHFESFGEVTKASLPKHQGAKNLKGYGFVHFRTEEAAIRALMVLNNTETDFGRDDGVSVTLRCNFGKKQGYRNRRKHQMQQYVLPPGSVALSMFTPGSPQPSMIPSQDPMALNYYTYALSQASSQQTYGTPYYYGQGGQPVFFPHTTPVYEPIQQYYGSAYQVPLVSTDSPPYPPDPSHIAQVPPLQAMGSHSPVSPANLSPSNTKTTEPM